MDGEMSKIILDLCGGTGAWSKPYKDAGYDVRNITLPDYDVRTYIPPENVYGILAAPPCTMFSVARTRAKTPRDLKGGMELILACLKIIWECQYQIKSDNQRNAPLKFWALENPKGLLEWFLGKPTFYFQPYEFGDNYTKKTYLWGYFNEPLKLILCSQPRGGKSVKDIFTPMQYKRDFKKISEQRAITPSGFAKAFFEANQ
jgi:hypothetical protein